jgi:hypothetical protein
MVTMPPIVPRCTWPNSRRSFTTCWTRLLGTENPMPWYPPLWLKMPVLMPTSSPRVLINAPPELPGLIAASVWMKSSYSEKPTFDRPVALMMPAVTVRLNWNGLPMARTHSPTCSLLESPHATGGSP